MSTVAYSYPIPGTDRKLAISQHAHERIVERGVPVGRLVELAARVVTVAPRQQAKWSWKGVAAVLAPTTRSIMLVTCWLEGVDKP